MNVLVDCVTVKFRSLCVDQLSVDEPSAVLKAANVWGALRGKRNSTIVLYMLFFYLFYLINER